MCLTKGSLDRPCLRLLATGEGVDEVLVGVLFDFQNKEQRVAGEARYILEVMFPVRRELNRVYARRRVRFIEGRPSSLVFKDFYRLCK